MLRAMGALGARCTSHVIQVNTTIWVGSDIVGSLHTPRSYSCMSPSFTQVFPYFWQRRQTL